MNTKESPWSIGGRRRPIAQKHIQISNPLLGTYFDLSISCRVHPKVQFLVNCNEPLWLAHEKRKKKVLRLWTLLLGIPLRTHLELKEHLAKHIGMVIRMAHHKRKFWDFGHYYWEYLEELIWNLGKMLWTHWEHQKAKISNPLATPLPLNEKQWSYWLCGLISCLGFMFLPVCITQFSLH